jgi:hypothetical protein
VVDEKAAEYVRLIFSLAASGKNTAETARQLNEQAIPTVSVYKGTGSGFWTNSGVYKILKNEVYLGKTIYKGFVTENTHEPLVSQLDFDRALSFMQKKNPRSKPPMPKHVFGSKVRCAYCGYAMVRYTKANPKFRCGTARLTNRYGCKDYVVLQSDVEKAVLAVIGKELGRAESVRNDLAAKSLKAKTAAEEKAIKRLKASLIRLFTDLASGKITQEAFISKRDLINAAIEIKKAKKPTAVNSGFDLNKRLDKRLADLLINKIFVYNANDIEIFWKFSS